MKQPSIRPDIMTPVTFIIPGVPVAKARPRMARLPNGRTITRTPTKTVRYENLVRMYAAEAFAGADIVCDPVRVEIDAIWPRPQSGYPSRRKDPNGLCHRSKRPDVDNVVKAILDGMDCVWTDDAVVAELVVRKLYAERGGKPRVEVRVSRVSPVAHDRASRVES